AGLRLPAARGGPLGDRRLHPRAAVQPGRPARRRQRGRQEAIGRQRGDAMSTAATTQAVPYRTLALRALAGGGVRALLCVVGAFVEPPAFFRAYLPALHYWLGLSLGALGIWLLHNMTGGAWGVVLQRILEAATRVLPLLAVLCVPLALGLPHVYEW